VDGIRDDERVLPGIQKCRDDGRQTARERDDNVEEEREIRHRTADIYWRSFGGANGIGETIEEKEFPLSTTSKVCSVRWLQ